MLVSIVSYGLALGAVYALIGITYNVMFAGSRVFSFTAGMTGGEASNRADRDSRRAKSARSVAEDASSARRRSICSMVTTPGHPPTPTPPEAPSLRPRAPP